MSSKSNVLSGDRVERIDSPEVKRDSAALRGTDLRTTAQAAVIWNTGFNLFRDLLQFAVMLVLVRLLDARAYGQFSLVTSIIGFISIFSFNNFIAYTLQVQTEEETHYQEHFTAGAVLQIGMFLLTNFIAVCVRWIPAYSSIAPLLHVMSVTFLFEWPCELRRKMIERVTSAAMCSRRIGNCRTPALILRRRRLRPRPLRRITEHHPLQDRQRSAHPLKLSRLPRDLGITPRESLPQLRGRRFLLSWGVSTKRKAANC